MPSTDNYGFRSPALTGVTPDIPRDLKALADDVDTEMLAQASRRTVGDKALVYEAMPVRADGGTNVGFNSAYAPTMSTPLINTLGASLSGRSIVIPTDGIYQLSCHFSWDTNSIGLRRGMIWLNPSSDSDPQPASAPPGGTGLVNQVVQAIAGAATKIDFSRVVSLPAGSRIMFATSHTYNGNLLLQMVDSVRYTSLTYVNIVRLGDI